MKIINIFLFLWLIPSNVDAQNLPNFNMHLHPPCVAQIEEPVGVALSTVPLAPCEHQVELRGVTICYLVRGSSARSARC